MEQSMFNRNRLLGIIGMVVGLCVLGGCNHTIDFEGMFLDAVPNPTSGPAATITKVTDLRVFEAEPKDKESPRLREPKDIGNRAVTSKAFGFVEMGYNDNYYVMVDHTVEQLAQTAVENALRNQGYVVVAADSPAAADAVPVEVGIRMLWFFPSPDGWRTNVELEVQSRLLTNPSGKETVTTNDMNYRWMVHESMARGIVYDTLNDVSDKLKLKLKKPE
jgi:hypothetical protein